MLSISFPSKPTGNRTDDTVIYCVCEGSTDLARCNSSDDATHDSSDDNADGSSRRADRGPQLRAVGRAGPAGSTRRNPLDSGTRDPLTFTRRCQWVVAMSWLNASVGVR